MSDRCKPHIGHFDRNTIAVVSDHREEFPEQFADEADIAADTEPCTCPMSVREKMPEEIVNQPFREVAGDNFAAEPGPHHSRGCPLWKPLMEVH
jgi:hypothetical protein